MDSRNNYTSYKRECLIKIVDISSENLEVTQENFPEIITVKLNF